MKHVVLIGALAGSLTAGWAVAQTAPAQKPATSKAEPATKAAPAQQAEPAKKARPAHKMEAASGATAPNSQPNTAPAPSGVPEGEVALGSVRVPRKVMADGKTLAAGTYQVRLTNEDAKPATGATQRIERWVEFMKGGKVVGREVASVVPDSEIAQVAKGPQPKKGGTRVEMLKGDDYLRIWINKAGANYLIHLPPAA